MKKPYPTSLLRRQSGIGLLELMIALTLGLFLLGGVLGTYVGSRQSYQQNEAMGRLQENARFAFQLLSRDLRGAGIPGCSGSDGLVSWSNMLNTKAKDGTTASPLASFAWDFSRNVLEGMEATGLNTWSGIAAYDGRDALTAAVVAPSAVSGTDVLTLRSPDSMSIRIVGQPAGNESGAGCVSSETLLIDPEPDTASPRLAVGDTVVAVTCGVKAAFLIRGYDAATGAVTQKGAASTDALRNNSVDFGGCMVTGYLTAMSAKSYYIGTNVAGVRALYRATVGVDADGDAELRPSELVEGVQDMQVTYGEDLDNDFRADTYVAANAVTKWANVVSLQVSLLMRSVDDNVVSTAQTYTFNGTATTAADRHLYQVITTTVALRSRVL